MIRRTLAHILQISAYSLGATAYLLGLLAWWLDRAVARWEGV